jgi:hypothetical protein
MDLACIAKPISAIDGIWPEAALAARGVRCQPHGLVTRSLIAEDSEINLSSPLLQFAQIFQRLFSLFLLLTFSFLIHIFYWWLKPM